MQLWWEFEKSGAARFETALYQERKRRAFERWYVGTYPDEAAAEFEKRSERLEALKKDLLS